ncbi:hypothetical protein EJ02DRAFT_473964 [Clathrospora elynae]|uniref:Gfd2/YDR514C-like C-terminal domain-containing protein n=1 Tax=Clathrospora elynae TaxID=706981 RepID=A0A6A5SCN8_9PLEO|nr:hypothetical protein EJ02DRAFT_473964 [Clathrospora elynae]
MASPARLECLRRLVQADLDALPDRPVSPDHQDTGCAGVSLEQSEIPISIQDAPSETDSLIKEAHPALEEPSDSRFVWVEGTEISYKPNLNSMRHSTAPPTTAAKTTTLAVTDLQRGDLASARHHFTPIQALAKYPYRFCNLDYKQTIASTFFDGGKFWQREWDLYYVWDHEPTKPLILVRESQVQALLKEINSQLKLSLRITDQQREDGLVVAYPDHPRCLPRYLGRSNSREEYDNMLENAPSETFRASGEPVHPPLEGRTLQDFKRLMQDAADVQKAKGKASKAKKQQERVVKQHSMADQFKRTQRYLGVRPSASDGAAQPGPLNAIDPSSCVPFAFEQSVVFVCVDVESYERAHHKITEVGVATLDTHDLIGIAPGVDGEEWRKKIRARHFRINENRHLVNSEFVSGYPDGFDFGESTFVPLKEAAQHVAACFHAPFGAHTSNGVVGSALMQGVNLKEKRNVIFLGHDTLGDIRYLQELGYDPMKVEDIVEALDTATMYRFWRRELQATSLGRILLAFDIPAFKLHNAGNDAVFTVQAMLAICVREATIRGSPELERMRTDERDAKLAAAVEEARQRVVDEANTWSETEAVGDGGAPVSLTSSDAPRPVLAQASSSPTPQHDDAPSFGGRGRGHGRGRGQGSAQRLWIPSEHGYGDAAARGGYRGSARGQLDSSASDRGGYRGRGQKDGRGRPDGRGRGRSRGRGGSFVPNGPALFSDYHENPEVRLLDLN